MERRKERTPGLGIQLGPSFESDNMEVQPTLSPRTKSRIFMAGPTESHESRATPVTSPSNYSSLSNTSENDAPIDGDQPRNKSKTFNQFKRKITFPSFPHNKHQPATVARRNARERNRVKQVNNGFASLKQHIPPEHRAKKMSKVETLRCAVEYIRRLQIALDRSRAAADGQGQLGESKLVFETMMDFEGSYEGTEESLPYQGSLGNPADKRLFPSASIPRGTSNDSSEFGDYEPYDEVTSGDEEELLDAISSWQQS